MRQIFIILILAAIGCTSKPQPTPPAQDSVQQAPVWRKDQKRHLINTQPRHHNPVPDPAK